MLDKGTKILEEETTVPHGTVAHITGLYPEFQKKKFSESQKFQMRGVGFEPTDPCGTGS
jgi:hypothetical protein